MPNFIPTGTDVLHWCVFVLELSAVLGSLLGLFAGFNGIWLVGRYLYRRWVVQRELRRDVLTSMCAPSAPRKAGSQ